MKLKRIQKELQALDDMVSSDISILRDRIEEASWDYSAARYRSLRGPVRPVRAGLGSLGGLVALVFSTLPPAGRPGHQRRSWVRTLTSVAWRVDFLQTEINKVVCPSSTCGPAPCDTLRQWAGLSGGAC